jgi:hypothetical protein
VTRWKTQSIGAELIPGFYELTLFVGKRAHHDHDEVDQCPDAKATQRKQLQDTGAYFAHVEAVYAEHAKKETQ